MAELTKAHVGKRPGCTRRRLMTAVAAVIAAVVVFYVETRALGLELASPAMGGRASAPITVDNVLTASILASLAAWMGMAMLEGMNVPRPRIVWTVIAVIVFLGSLAVPLTGTGIPTNVRLGLAVLHLVVAAILIPLIPDWPPRRERTTA